MAAIGEWVDTQIHTVGQHATLVHGDYKAMNCFVPLVAESGMHEAAVLIDFQWTAVGLGMADVTGCPPTFMCLLTDGAF